MARLGHPLSTKVIAREAGVTISQARRHLNTLIAEGFAQHDPDSGCYDLGPEATMLGLAALSGTDAVRTAGIVISEFVRRTGRTVKVCTLAPLGPTIIDWHSGIPPVIPSLRVGSALPLLHSATGHVFMAFAAQSEVYSLIQGEREQGGLDGQNIDALITRVRGQGFATVSLPMAPGLRSTAFPIFDLQGRPILSAAVIASDAFEISSDPKVREEFGAVCAEISKRLGGRPLFQVPA
jgi:DNA-binding IclR family transcriptional regulator